MNFAIKWKIIFCYNRWKDIAEFIAKQNIRHFEEALELSKSNLLFNVK